MWGIFYAWYKCFGTAENSLLPTILSTRVEKQIVSHSAECDLLFVSQKRRQNAPLAEGLNFRF